jgi:hypothetical protein
MIKQIGGWKTTAVFHRYAIVDSSAMAAAMRQLEQHQAELAKPAPRTRILRAYLSPPRPKWPH